MYQALPCYGDIYVVDRDRSEVEIGGSTIFFGSNVWHFNSEGEFEATQGEFGSGAMVTTSARSASIDNQGNVCPVTGSWYAQGEVPDARAQMFTCELDFITRVGSSGSLTALARSRWTAMPGAPAGIDVGGSDWQDPQRGRQRRWRPILRAGRQPDMMHRGPGAAFERTWGRGVLDGAPVGQICLSSCRQGERFHHG